MILLIDAKWISQTHTVAMSIERQTCALPLEGYCPSGG